MPTSAVDEPHGFAIQAVAPLRSQRRHRLRRLWLSVHLWIGLLAGGLFVLMGLTGSFLVFHEQVDVWLHPDRFRSTGAASDRSLEEIVAAARAAHPHLSGPDTLFLPHGPDDVVRLVYREPVSEETRPRKWEVTVDPGTAEVRGTAQAWGTDAISWLYELHRSAHLGKAGETVIGGVAALLLLSVGSGVYLWWPRKGRLHDGFLVRSRPGSVRRQYDVHRLTGIMASVLLVLLALTGLYLEFPRQTRAIVAFTSPLQEPPEGLSSHPSAAPPVTLDRAVSTAQALFPDAELRWIGLPAGTAGVFQIGFRRRGEHGASDGETMAILDQYTEAVLWRRDWLTLTPGETLLAWLFPLHTGEAFGLPGRLLVFTAGFLPLALYVTALRMWWGKRQAHRRQRARPGLSSSPSWRRFLMSLAQILLLFATAVACRDSNSTATEAAQAPPPIRVELASALLVPLPETIMAVGTLEADEAIVVRPEIAGRIRRILFEEGQMVQEGQALFELDDKELVAQLNQARAQEKIARLTYERLKRLSRTGTTVISPQQLDEARSELQATEANTVLYATRLEKTQIRAPFGGQVGLRQVSPGDYVQPGQDLVNLEDLRKLKIDFKVPETFLARLATGQALEVATDAYPEERFAGRIYALDPRADATNRALRIRATVPNPDRKLRPGLFANVAVPLGSAAEALVIPEEAVDPEGHQTLVFRIENGRAHLTPISLGRRERGYVEVLSGLRATDRVVRAGHQKLKDGASVEVVAQ